MLYLIKKSSLALLVSGLSLLLLTWVTQETAQAQVLYGGLTGNVSDSSGGAVPGAAVTALNEQTNDAREAITNDAGRYTFATLQSGRYTLTVRLTGFKEARQTGVEIRANIVTRVDLSVEVGGLTEQVTVEAAAVTLQTEKSDVSTVLDDKEVKNLPLSNYKNYQSLINLVPGATPALFQNSVDSTPARGLTTNVNGTNRNNNRTIVDGASNVFVWLPHHTAYVPPSESVEEVSISTASFDADQGLTGGAIMTLVTKSGTNEVHGSAFGYNENNLFRARNFFVPQEKEPKHIRNIVGATIGGPISQDKLFYFASWEYLAERRNMAGLFTVPTADIRAGDFSRTGTTIFDPLTGNPDGSGRTAFANNIIPSSRFSPAASKMLSFLPAPNLSGSSENLFREFSRELDRHNFDLKIDKQAQKYRLWGKYSAMWARTDCPPVFGEGGGPCSGVAGFAESALPGRGRAYVQSGTFGTNFTASHTFIVDGSFGWTRQDQDGVPLGIEKNIGLDVLGIPGTNGTDPRQGGAPIFTVTGYTQFGGSPNWAPFYFDDQNYSGKINANNIRGNHDIRWGFDVVRFELNQWQPEIGQGPRGGFSFSDTVTALRGGPASDRFNAFGAFLLGLPSTSAKSLQYVQQTFNEWQFGWYIRDRWHVTPKLNITLGLRYEMFPLGSRADDRGIERLDLQTMEVLFGGYAGLPKNLGAEWSKMNFAPRVGIAYELNDSTVIRSGYGISWDPINLSRPLRGFYPIVISQAFEGANVFQPFGPLDTAGIPPLDTPDLSKGRAPLPPTALMRTVFEGDFSRGYIQSWNLFLQRKMPQDFIVDVGYVGTQTVRQMADEELNAAPVGGGNTGRPFFAQFGRTASTNRLNGWLSANYHALQAAINRPFKRGLFLKGAYTWSHAINMTDEDGWASLTINAPGFLQKNRANAGYDVRHIFQMGFVYELPFGPNKQFAQTGAARAILGDWQINGVVSSFSGRPFTVTASGASLNAPASTQTADQVKESVEKLGGRGPGQPWMDPAAFRQPTEVRFGNTNRNQFIGPGQSNLDFSIFRRFRLREEVNLEFRTEVFNFTNTPHFGAPVNNITSGNFLSFNGAFDDARQIRFALRLEF